MDGLAALLTVLAAVLGVAAIAFAVLWLVARHRGNRIIRSRAAQDQRRLDLELAHAEQAGKLQLIRELHEVTVTDLATLVGHAEGAKYTVRADPEAALRSAATIEGAAREILDDVRRVLTLVHEAQALGLADPGLGSIDELYDVMSEAGLDIRVLETGTPFPLKGGAQLTVYRILQESLDNALIHGGPGTRVTVAFTWTADSLSISIEDDGVLAAQRREGGDPVYTAADDMGALTGAVEGRGLSELRERAAVYGGVFSAVPVPGMGFTVSVAFPRLRYNNGIHSVNLGPAGGGQ
jgi:signal transduction histidine kinase